MTTSKTANSVDTDNPAYLGTDPMYQNHASDSDAPMSSEDENQVELEDRAKEYEETAVVKKVDATDVGSVGVTDDEGYLVVSDATPLPTFEEFVADRAEARGPSTAEVTQQQSHEALAAAVAAASAPPAEPEPAADDQSTPPQS